MRPGLFLLPLLATLAAPAAALEITPLPPALRSEPQFDFGVERPTVSRWHVHSDNPRGAYVVGTARVEGMAGEEVMAIAALPGAKGRGSTYQNNYALDTWRGRRIRVSARMKGEEGANPQLWLRLGGFDPGQHRYHETAEQPVQGAAGWRTYEIVMDVPPDTKWMNYGFFTERGRAFAEAFAVEVVGADVPAVALAGVRADGWQVYQEMLDRIAANEKARERAQRSAWQASWREQRRAREREEWLSRPTPWCGSAGCNSWTP